MLYRLLKIPARFALLIYCRHLYVNNKDHFKKTGPILIAANHPNSFLDAILLATLFNKPIYSLVRGDVYKKGFYARLLGSLNMLPVFRISEGAHNLGQNYDTFTKCREIFKKNGIVLIFSEGRCINEWKLRPLKKGTARLAISSWEEGIDLLVIPAGINYQSFTSFGKNIELRFGSTINRKDIMNTNGYGNTINTFNNRLQHELQSLVAEIDKKDLPTLKKKFSINLAPYKKALLAIPAALGYIFHAPLYLPVQKISWKKAAHNDHYDSVMVGTLFLLYPLYLAAIAIIVYVLFAGWYWLLPIAILPFCAWAFVQVKKQF